MDNLQVKVKPKTLFKHLLKFVDYLLVELIKHDIQLLLRLKPRCICIRGVSPREDFTRWEEYVKDVQNILSIE